MDKVGVIIATYGNKEHWEKVKEPAWASIEAQTRMPDNWIWHHGLNLQNARNTAAIQMSEMDWFIFLDADDTLDPRYIEKMLEGTGDIRQPSTLGVWPDGTEDDEPALIPSKPLVEGNYIVIGAMCRADIFFRVGGFGPEAMFEDWALWLRMEEAGATIGQCPEAVYRISVGKEGRNTGTFNKQDYWYHKIKNDARNRRRV